MEQAKSRWSLIDSILRRIAVLAAHVGIPPQQLLERAQAVFGEMRGRAAKPTITDARSFEEVHSGAEVMRTWYRDIDFVDAKGNPKRIPVAGKGASFEELVQRTVPGVGSATVLSDLIAAEAVVQGPDGMLEARSFRVVHPGAVHRSEVALYAVDNLLGSLNANVQPDPKLGLLQTEAFCFQFDRKQLPRIKRQLTDICVSNMEEADDWLHQHRLAPGASPRDATTVVVGLYLAIRDSTSTPKKRK